MRFDAIQNNFTAGELSPKLWGRNELEKYTSGLAILENMIVQPQGGVEKRGGSHYVATVKDSSKDTVVVEFVYNNLYSYILEFGDLYMRVYVNNAQVSGPYEIVTTYTQSEVADLRFCQDFDTLYIAHKDHTPAKLTRTAHDSWTLADITFTAKPAEWLATNYPTLCWFYEQRLFWAATPDEPNKIWGSQSTDYFNLTLGTGLDNEALIFVVKAVHKFLWVSPGQEILLGGSNAEFKLSANALNEALTPSNVRPVLHTSYGSSFIPVIRIDDGVMFVQKGGRKLRRLSPKFQSGSYSDSYQASDVTILSDHIAKSSMTDTAYAVTPESVLWGVRSDGVLIGLTYEPEHKVYGWHRHLLGGTATKVKSIAVAKVVNGMERDELWMVVERTVDGSTVKYIEYIDGAFPDDADIEDAFFVDSGITKTGSAFTSVTGLDHLEGESVQILGDGAPQAPKVVASGAITLDTAVDKAHVGLQYTITLETLPIEGGNPIGTSQTILKRIKNVALRLNKSLGFDVGDVYGNMDTYYFGPKVMDDPIPLFTGDTDPIPFAGSHDRQSRIRITQDIPLPFNLLALIYQARTG